MTNDQPTEEPVWVEHMRGIPTGRSTTARLADQRSEPCRCCRDGCVEVGCACKAGEEDSIEDQLFDAAWEGANS